MTPLFNPIWFDSARLRARPDQVGFLLDWVRESLYDRLSLVKQNFHEALLWDGYKGYFRDVIKTGHLQVAAGIESLPSDRYDLILAPLMLHAVHDLPQTLSRLKSMLNPGGLFLGALYGENTLIELRHALASAEVQLKGGVSPRLMPMVSLKDMARLMQIFHMPVVDIERTQVLYKDPFQGLQDLKDLGERNILMQKTRGLTTPRLFETAVDHYPRTETTGLHVTIQVIHVSGWAS